MYALWKPGASNRSDRKNGASRHSPDVRLLSVQKCRSLLPSDCELSDAEIEALRDHLYALAGVAVDMTAEQNDASRLQLGQAMCASCFTKLPASESNTVCEYQQTESLPKPTW
jgi:hypothetical protein